MCLSFIIKAFGSEGHADLLITRIKLNSIAAFIFDMDGVIVDSNPAHDIALKQFCQKYGQDLTEEDLRDKVYGRRNQDWLINIFGPLPPDVLAAYGEEKEALFREIYDATIEPLPGLASFLRAIREAGIPSAIATSAPRSNVDFVLVKTGFGPFFDTILDASFVSHGKPHPEVYLKTAAALNYEPHKCVVFEDSFAGVLSAKNAGCKVVGVTTTHGYDELTGTDATIDDFSSLDPNELISKLFGR